ncbi:MAG: hypothetical protein ACRCX2_00385 [Paraclostridium sp.]
MDLETYNLLKSRQSEILIKLRDCTESERLLLEEEYNKIHYSIKAANRLAFLKRMKG